jgi:hypothetical protein
MNNGDDRLGFRETQTEGVNLLYLGTTVPCLHTKTHTIISHLIVIGCASGGFTKRKEKGATHR